MLIALPEIDGATNPTLFAGRHGADGCNGCARRCRAPSALALTSRAMAPCPERIEALADKVLRLAHLRRAANADRRVGIVRHGFPPNAGAAGIAAYMSVFESLFNMLGAMKAAGYDLTPPETLKDLRQAVLQGNAAQSGQPANVAATVSAAEIVARSRWRGDVERAWGARTRAAPDQWARRPCAGLPVRQCVCRVAANLWRRRRPDAAAVRKGFRAHPCLHDLLSLAQG